LLRPGGDRLRFRLSFTPGKQTLLTSVIVGALGAITGVLVARLLGPSGRGDLAAVMSWAGFALGIATLGLEDALTYYGRSLAKNPKFDSRAIQRWSVCVGLSAGLLAALVVFVLPITVGEKTWIVLTIGAGGAVLVTQTCLLGLVIGLGGYSTWQFARIVGPAVYAVGITALFLADQDSLELVVTAVGASWAAPLLPTYAYVRRFLRQQPQPAGHPLGNARGEWRKVWRYGLRAQATKLSTRANARLDQALLVFFVSDTKLGLYAVAATVATLTPNQLYDAQARLAFGRFMGIVESRRLEGVDAWRSARKVLILALAVQGSIALLAPFAVPFLFGESFRDAGPVASALALATVPMAVSRTLQSWLMATERVTSSAWLEATAVVVQIGLLIPLSASPLGIWGAVIASAAGYSTSMVLQGLAIRHHSRREAR
jgi:enterobacterial common antigen flippase